MRRPLSVRRRAESRPVWRADGRLFSGGVCVWSKAAEPAPRRQESTMLDRQVDTSYESYTGHEEYISTNRPLLDAIDFGNVEVVADLACGAGMFCTLLFARKPSLRIWRSDVH